MKSVFLSLLPSDGLLTSCRCSYEILDAEVQQSSWSEFGVDFFSTNQCPGTSAGTCNYFSGAYYTDCFSFGGNPDCVDVWEDLPPSPINRFAFNCEPLLNSSFNVLLNSIGTNDCVVGDFMESTITFRIVCVETCENYSYLAYSDPVTLHFYDADPSLFGEYWFSGSETTIIELHGCGCTPTTVF